jgi:hypothetical protein
MYALVFSEVRGPLGEMMEDGIKLLWGPGVRPRLSKFRI